MSASSWTNRRSTSQLLCNRLDRVAVSVELIDALDDLRLVLVDGETDTGDQGPAELISPFWIFYTNAPVAEASSSSMEAVERLSFEAASRLGTQFLDVEAVHNAVRCEQYVALLGITLGFWTYVAGILAGLFTLAFRRVAASVPSITQFEVEDYSLRGTISIWLAIFAIGAIAEESWRALCISSFHEGPRFGNAIIYGTFHTYPKM